MPCAAQNDQESPIVNLMVDFNIPASPTNDQIEAAKSSLINLSNELNMQHVKGTLFLTYDAISSAMLLVTSYGTLDAYEMAISGNHLDEKLSTQTYEEQKAILDKSRTYVESAKVCGLNTVTVSGFMPQSFDQDEDTYNVLDDLGIPYDAGFQAGLLYAPGHENDVWPYLVEGHNFYAVPVSTYNLSDQKVVLQDSYFKSNGHDATQWYNALVGKLDEIEGKDEPMVILVSTSISGSGDWLDALSNFLDYSSSKNATFITTTGLVNMTLPEGYVPPVASRPESECTTCDSKSSVSAASLDNLTAPILANLTVTQHTPQELG